MKNLTLIVPIYNTEKYIINNMSSWKEASKAFEVIFVQDSLTGEVEGIAKEVGAKFIKKENGNWGSVINISKKLDIKTEWVKIIDADDSLNINNLIDAIEKNQDADLIIGHVENIYSNRKEIVAYKNFKKYVPFLHSMIVKTNVFQETRDLPEGISYMDTMLGFELYEKAELIVGYNKVLYYHLKDIPNQSTSKENLATHKFETAQEIIVNEYSNNIKNPAVLRGILSLLEMIIWRKKDSVTYKRKYKKMWSRHHMGFFTNYYFMVLASKFKRKKY